MALPIFIAYAGSFTFGNSGMPGNRTLCALYVDKNMDNSASRAKIKTIFEQKAKSLRESGLTQMHGQHFIVGDQNKPVLVLGTYKPGTVTRLCTIINVPATGPGAPRGTILTNTDGTVVTSGSWEWKTFGTNAAFRYGDWPTNSRAISYIWWAPGVPGAP